MINTNYREKIKRNTETVRDISNDTRYDYWKPYVDTEVVYDVLSQIKDLVDDAYVELDKITCLEEEIDRVKEILWELSNNLY